MAKSKVARAMAATARELEAIAESHRINTDRYRRIRRVTQQMAVVEPLLNEPLMNLHRRLDEIAKLSADLHLTCESAAAQALRVAEMAGRLYDDDQGNGAQNDGS